MNQRALDAISKANARRFRKPGQPTCPHCGGMHWGQRFDDCPYLKLATDEAATEEQRQNASEWLRLQREGSKA